VHAELFSLLAKDPAMTVAVDLAAQTLTLPGGCKVDFPVDSSAKQCLLEGVDELGYILMQEASIAAFEAKREGSLNTLSGG
jgi:3-isopropylmalate/(R)-2-methylmalate dehydratase small subunit